MGYTKQQFQGNEWVGATCDNCGSEWEHYHEGWTLMPDELSIWNELDADGWIDGEDCGKPKENLYCSECWTMDEHDNIKLKSFI